jgi:hypothetical protein
LVPRGNISKYILELGRGPFKVMRIPIDAMVDICLTCDNYRFDGSICMSKNNPVNSGEEIEVSPRTLQHPCNSSTNLEFSNRKEKWAETFWKKE